jgi:transposase InsO family protein
MVFLGVLNLVGERSERRACRTLGKRAAVWSDDFVFDQTESGGRLKWLPVLDEFTRECLWLEVGRSMTSDEVIGILERLVVRRGAPEFMNNPCPSPLEKRRPISNPAATKTPSPKANNLKSHHQLP